MMVGVLGVCPQEVLRVQVVLKVVFEYLKYHLRGNGYIIEGSVLLTPHLKQQAGDPTLSAETHDTGLPFGIPWLLPMARLSGATGKLCNVASSSACPSTVLRSTARVRLRRLRRCPHRLRR